MEILQVARIASKVALLAESAAVGGVAARARDYLRELRRLLDDHREVLVDPGSLSRGATRRTRGAVASAPERRHPTPAGKRRPPRGPA